MFFRKQSERSRYHWLFESYWMIDEEGNYGPYGVIDTKDGIFVTEGYSFRRGQTGRAIEDRQYITGSKDDPWTKPHKDDIGPFKTLKEAQAVAFAKNRIGI